MSTFDARAEVAKLLGEFDGAAGPNLLIKELTALVQSAFSAGLAAGLERAEAIARVVRMPKSIDPPLDDAFVVVGETTRDLIASNIASERERTRGTPG